MKLYIIFISIVFTISGRACEYACEYNDSIIMKFIEREKIDSLELNYFIPKYASDIIIRCVNTDGAFSVRFVIESFRTSFDNIELPDSMSMREVALLACKIALSKPKEIYSYRKKSRKTCESDFPRLYSRIYIKGRKKAITNTIYIGNTVNKQTQLVLEYIVEYSDYFRNLINKLDASLFCGLRSCTRENAETNTLISRWNRLQEK